MGQTSRGRGQGRGCRARRALSPPDTLEPSLQPPPPDHSLESRQESPVRGAPRDGSQMFTQTLGGHTNQADPAQPLSGAWGSPGHETLTPTPPHPRSGAGRIQPRGEVEVALAENNMLSLH